MSHNVTIYTSSGCSYCQSAKTLLQKRSIPYQEVEISKANIEQWHEVTKRSGSRTTPQIFFGDRFVGGFAELNQLDQRDQLASLKDDKKDHSHHCCSC